MNTSSRLSAALLALALAAPASAQVVGKLVIEGNRDWVSVPLANDDYYFDGRNVKGITVVLPGHGPFQSQDYYTMIEEIECPDYATSPPYYAVSGQFPGEVSENATSCWEYWFEADSSFLESQFSIWGQPPGHTWGVSSDDWNASSSLSRSIDFKHTYIELEFHIPETPVRFIPTYGSIGEVGERGFLLSGLCEVGPVPGLSERGAVSWPNRETTLGISINASSYVECSLSLAPIVDARAVSVDVRVAEGDGRGGIVSFSLLIDRETGKVDAVITGENAGSSYSLPGTLRVVEDPLEIVQP